MKHLCSGICVAICLTSVVCQAQTLSADVQAINQIQAIQKSAQIDLNKIIEDGKEAAFSDELLLGTLLSTPYEKRQYIFPVVHEVVFFSKKIKTHPDVIVWKGKKPTDIAPQLQNFADRYLDDLNPMHYVLLDPDLWKQSDIPNGALTVQWDASDWDKLGMTRANTFYTMPDAQSFYKMTPEAKAAFNNVTLTDNDVTRLAHTVTALPDFYESVPYPDDLKTAMRNGFDTEETVLQNYAHPFKGLVTRIQNAGEGEAFEVFIQKQGWKNTAEFAEQSDTALKALRTQKLIPAVAMQLSKIRALHPLKPGEAMTPMQMYAELYNVSAGNTLFMIKHADTLYPILKNEFLGPARMPIYLD